jgi:hypothetical protein
MGTTMGMIIIPVITPLNGKLAVVNPNAAKVPNAVAKNVVAKAIMKLFFMDKVHMMEWKNSMYQRKLMPGIG